MTEIFFKYINQSQQCVKMKTKYIFQLRNNDFINERFKV
jgi:hypothetical protein